MASIYKTTRKFKPKYINKGKQMTTMDTTVGYVTTLEKATETATQWHRPELGYHTQVVTKDGGYICRVVING